MKHIHVSFTLDARDPFHQSNLGDNLNLDAAMKLDTLCEQTWGSCIYIRRTAMDTNLVLSRAYRDHQRTRISQNDILGGSKTEGNMKLE
jgi:hypothetical protein